MLVWANLVKSQHFEENKLLNISNLLLHVISQAFIDTLYQIQVPTHYILPPLGGCGRYVLTPDSRLQTPDSRLQTPDS